MIRFVSKPRAIFDYCQFRSSLKWNVVSAGNDLQCDDLFLVTSCTNPSDLSGVVNHNPSHGQEQRGEELLQTFHSIRKCYPQAIIINLENSSVEKKLANQIIEHCDFRRDYSSDLLIQRSRKFNNKAIPWVAKVLKFLREESSHIVAKRLHILCGRYFLMPDAFNDFESEGAYFRYYPEYENVSTRYVIYNQVNFYEIGDSLEAALWPLFAGYSLEDSISFAGLFRKHLLGRVGVSGMVNGQHYISE